jgi:MFS family permease
MRDYQDVLRIPGFRNLWLGQAISQLGDALYYVTFMFMVKELTNSYAMVGFVGAMEALPFLVFGGLAGVYADRYDRRLCMLWSDVVSGAILVAFGVALLVWPVPPIWSLLVVPFLLSTARTLFMPAKSAAIPMLVPGEKVITANSLSLATQNLMPMIGLALSAGVLAFLYDFSPQYFFVSSVLLNSLSFFLSAVFIARVPAVPPAAATLAESPSAKREFLSGLAYIRGRHDIKIEILLLTVFRLGVAPFFVIYIAANEQWFDGKPGTLAWLEFAFFVGMIISSFAVNSVKIRRPGSWFAGGLGVCGLCIVAMAYSPNVWLFAFWNFICGLAIPFVEIPMTSYVQLSVPNEFRGRVNSVLNMVATGMMPIGAGLGGILLEKAGLVGAFWIMGAGVMLACLIGFGDRIFRNVIMPTRSVDEEPEGSPQAVPVAVG